MSSTTEPDQPTPGAAGGQDPVLADLNWLQKTREARLADARRLAGVRQGRPTPARG